MGLDAAVVERVDSHPQLKARFGPWYFVEAAVDDVPAQYVVNPPRLEVEVDGRTIAGVSVFIQNAERYTYFKDRPVQLVEGARFDSGDLAGVVLTRARPYDVPTVTFRALSGAARIAKHRAIAGFAQAKEVAVRSTRRPARSRCTSTATTSERAGGALLDRARRAADGGLAVLAEGGWFAIDRPPVGR